MVLKRYYSQKLRTGFTTGACAAAASKAALLALLNQQYQAEVSIHLPGDGQAAFTVKECKFNGVTGFCSVIKDAGDDPDITHGIEIQATVLFCPGPDIHIQGGQGVGIVTKPGLEIQVGQPAINPVPRKMITEEISSVLASCLRREEIQVIISVPQGEELAKRTLNPRLGIMGGISILGTTGIVIPYSRDAYQACISQAISVAAAGGNYQVVLTTGRRSEKFAQNLLSLPEECFIQAGDFIGFALRAGLKKGIKKVIIWGMIGKITKLATGHLYTNISDSEVDIDFLTALARESGISADLLADLNATVSANHFREAIPPDHIKAIADKLCGLACRKCWNYVDRKLSVECILSDYNGAVLGRAVVEK